MFAIMWKWLVLSIYMLTLGTFGCECFNFNDHWTPNQVFNTNHNSNYDKFGHCNHRQVPNVFSYVCMLGFRMQRFGTSRINDPGTPGHASNTYNKKHATILAQPTSPKTYGAVCVIHWHVFERNSPLNSGTIIAYSKCKFHEYDHRWRLPWIRSSVGD